MSGGSRPIRMPSSFLHLSENGRYSPLVYGATVSRNLLRCCSSDGREYDASFASGRFGGFQWTVERERPRVRPGVERVEGHAQPLVRDARGGTGEVRHLESEPGVH